MNSTRKRKKEFLFQDFNEDYIIDRDPIKEQINDVVNISQSSAIFIYSYSGIGKTAIAIKIMKDIESKNIIPIRVRMAPSNSVEELEEGAYLFELFNCVKNSLNKIKHNEGMKKLTFDYYIKHCLNSKKRKKIIVDMFDNFYSVNSKSNFFKLVSYLFFSFALKIKGFDSFQYENENTLENRLLFLDYLKYVLNKKRFFINIDNIQNIDSMSKKIFVDIMNECTKMNTFYLFEFTVSEKNQINELIDLITVFKESGIYLNYIKINNIETKYAVQIIKKSTSIKFSKKYELDLENFYNYHANGNIKRLIDYDIRSANGYPITSYNPSLDNLIDCGKNGLIVLAFIILCNGIIPDKLLKQLIDNLNKDFVNIEYGKEMNNLISHNIISLYSDCIILDHASIMDIWYENSDLFSLYEIIAIKILRKKLEYMLGNEQFDILSLNKILIILLKIYEKTDVPQIAKLLDYLEQYIDECLSPITVWDFLKETLLMFLQNYVDSSEIFLHVFKICNDYQLYYEAYDFIKYMEKSIKITPSTLIFKYLFLSQLNEPAKCIKEINDILNNQTFDDQIIINLKMIQIICYRNQNCYEDCRKIIEELEDMKKIKSLKEYGYILRLKALYLPRNIGKMMINESISFFQNISEETQEAKSRLTYSFYLAICGQLDEAKNELMIAKNILKLSHASMHIIEVNMSAIRLLSNETDNSILEGLKRAEYTSLTAFDKLAVLNNKLVYCILKEDKNMISSIEEKILRLFEKENDKHIKAFMYYNLYYYYKFIEENEEKSMIYYNKAFKLRKHCKTLEARLANRNNIEDGTEFLLTRPFHVCFLSFWRFDPFF